MAKLELAKEQQAVFGEALREASAGRLPWLDLMVCRAGYVRADFHGLQGKDVARVWGVSAQAISNWHRAGCPRNQDRCYDLTAVIRWREKIIEEGAGLSGPNSPALEEYRRAKAEIAKLDLEVRRGQLLDRMEVEDGLCKRVVVLRTSLLGLARGVAPQLEGRTTREIYATLDSRIRDMLRQYAEG